MIRICATMISDVRRLISSFAAFGWLLPLASAAAVFPDVPAEHQYNKHVEFLVGAQVLNGNPDGTFAPDRAVNRAEFLTMLYRARGMTPDPANAGCFRADVVAGSWYESVVCDAAARRIVNGYPDGRFRPEEPVNRVEALKMMLEVFGIEPGRYGIEQRDIIKFVDVSTSAWYSGYLYTAFSKNILPIPGQDGSRFYPEWPLLRGEAAAYIYNALQVQLAEQRGASSSIGDVSSADASSSSVDGDDAASEQRRSSSQNSARSSSAPAIHAVTFPFEVSGKFSAKAPVSYTFSLVSNLVASLKVSLQSGQQGGVVCRLYELDAQGFSIRYYIGYQEGGSCYLLAALVPGTYQLQVSPTVANTTYTAAMKAGTGDGNDGFREAKRLLPGVPKTMAMGGANFADYYAFTVDKERSLTVDLTAAGAMSCMIFPLENVDLASFATPSCNQAFAYTPGEYVVVVGRGTTKGSKQTYTLLLR